MCPLYALVCLGLAAAGFSLNFGRRLWLVFVLARAGAWQFDHPATRLRRILAEGFGQRALRRDRWPGIAHLAIFWGFVLLLPRAVVLFGRGFDPEFGSGLGRRSEWGCLMASGYHWLRVMVTLAVLAGVGVFAALRLARHSRFRPTTVALGILAAIAVLMLSDVLYEAAGTALARGIPLRCDPRWSAEFCDLGQRVIAPFGAGSQRIAVSHPEPLTTLLAGVLSHQNNAILIGLAVGSYGLHLLLIATFVALLPATKHLHLVAVWPNLFFDDLGPRARLKALARDPDALLTKVEASMDAAAGAQAPDEAAVGDPVARVAGGKTDSAEAAGSPAARRRSPIGIESLMDVSAKQRLDWFACTACGRCTEHCPAAATGKPLDPKALTQSLRAHIEATPLHPARAFEHLGIPLVPQVLDPEAIWACTNCAACEEHCPTAVRTVAPIVDLRRHLLSMRAEAPPELQRVFDGLERHSNAWGLARAERAKWAEGLDVPLLCDVPRVEYLYWVGCAASYDVRAQAVARAMVQLMRRAKISFAILGSEEHCTGDVARRAGNELLFLQLAQRNIECLNRYQAEGRFQRIVTACPHCLTTLGHEYPELGGQYAAVSHVEAIEQWVAAGHLRLPSSDRDLRTTYHDPCTLARYAGVTQAPLQLLARTPGVSNAVPLHHGRDTLCCGAGGAQMWLKERGSARISHRRRDELNATGADTIVTACPFCRLMLDDAAQSVPSSKQSVVDIAEIVEQGFRASDSEKA